MIDESSLFIIGKKLISKMPKSIRFFIVSSFLGHSQMIKSIELSNSVTFSKINVDYNNPNSYEGKAVFINPSVGFTFLKYKYLNLGVLLESNTVGINEKFSLIMLYDNPALESKLYYNYRSEINFISFGLKINPNYGLTKIIKIYANLNPYLNYRIFTTNNLDILSKMYENDMKKVVPTLHYGIGVMLKVFHNTDVFVDVSSVYYFSDILDNDNVNVKIMSVDVKTGLRYTFGKKEKTAGK